VLMQDDGGLIMNSLLINVFWNRVGSFVFIGISNYGAWGCSEKKSH
jgi:hypothetical protein